MSKEKCDPNVFTHGVSLGFYDMPKEEAESACVEMTKKTGRLHDWHYVGGRVHILAMPMPTDANRQAELQATYKSDWV